MDIPKGSTPKIPLGVFLTGTGTEATGKTVAITISKNGAEYGNPSAGATNATEIGNGDYYFTPSATDTGTEGSLIVRGTSSGCDNTKAYHTVVAVNRSRGESGLVPGAAITGTLSSTQMTTDLTEATDNHYIGRTVFWTTGVLAGSQAMISDYDGASKMLTFAATQTAEAPSNGDAFVIA